MPGPVLFSILDRAPGTARRWVKNKRNRKSVPERIPDPSGDRFCREKPAETPIFTKYILAQIFHIVNRYFPFFDGYLSNFYRIAAGESRTVRTGGWQDSFGEVPQSLPCDFVHSAEHSACSCKCGRSIVNFTIYPASDLYSGGAAAVPAFCTEELS